MCCPDWSGDLPDQGISQDRPRVVAAPPGQLNKFITDPVPSATLLIGEGPSLGNSLALSHRSLHENGHSWHAAPTPATTPLRGGFPVRHRLPGHAEVSRVNAHAGLPLIPGIYWPNLISASIPIETPHGSALGRRQLAESWHSYPSGPGPEHGLATATRPVPAHAPSVKNGGMKETPIKEAIKLGKQVLGRMGGHETILSSGNWCCVDLCSHDCTESWCCSGRGRTVHGCPCRR